MLIIAKRSLLSNGKLKSMKATLGPCRVRGRGSRGKPLVFSLFKQRGKVYTEIVPPIAPKATLQGILRCRVDLKSIIQTVGVVMMVVSIRDIRNTSTTGLPINVPMSMG